MSVVLENALIVQHDSIRAEPLTFVAGRVAEFAAGAWPVDLSDHLIFPGLINAHDHLQLNNLRPVPRTTPFPNSYAWIDAVGNSRAAAKISDTIPVPSEDRHWQGGLKNLLAGVTTVAHHDPWHPVLDDANFPVGVLRHFGWSHSLGLGEDGAPRYGPPVRSSFAATPSQQAWIIHLAEGTDAVAAAELSQLDAFGCLASNTVLVHAVGLGDSEIDRVIDAGAAVIWCPASNVETLGRTLRPRRLFDAGCVTLGTDSRLTGSRDLLTELRAASAHSELLPHELLRLVTADASRILRIAECGALKAGHQADCVIIRAGADPYTTLMSTDRCDIRAVVRAGVPHIADPDFADWFAHCGIEVLAARLDGRPKLLAELLARTPAVELEAGLSLE